ncbi:mandelate racemase/muconate lactonizing enzyme family protein [Oceanomicrobium pacificus]|uniref:Mandelate racemase/muconate lactonizing enzyme family protein n=1 Tax=Oceanomicrobium pacificus TaxID=2692916 RepID=A0A6B0U0X8_9RHOB|nr:mandelate racemase/muconate lactonizing enzyme family protein [Oceanomicrobium pacificus]MXU66893.1 mandelate racemase/muconate lactonizing enzyme family protein [Oceanomicrobium pacificus]
MARITHVEIFMLDLKPKVKRVDAIQSFVSQETPFVRITDADGAVGLGYSYTIGQGGGAIMSLLRETLVPQLIGREAEEIERIWRDLLFSTHATAVGAITSLALAAIDTALWDLRCKRAELPLWRMLGGSKPAVPMYTTEGGWLHKTTDTLVADALAAKEQGFSGSKVKIGKPHLSEDRERLAAVREAVGPAYEIMTDGNQSFTRAEAMRRARVLEELDIAWFEEPIPADDVMEHARLAASTSVPIAVGESMYSVSQFKDYLVTGAASIVQVDVARIGGITPWMKVAHMAEAHNVPVCPHFLMELHVSLVCAIPNAPWLEFIPQLDGLTASSMRMEAGKAMPSDVPGLGIDWDHDRLDAGRIDGLTAMVG